MKTTITNPAAAGLALASLAAELLIQGIAAVLIPALALALALAGCGHELALTARRSREALAAAAAEPAAEPSLADLFAAASREMARSDARLYRSVGQHIANVRQLLDQVEHVEAPAAAAVTARREKQAAAYRDLAGLTVRELRQLAREAGHRQLARQGRRNELLAALVPA